MAEKEERGRARVKDSVGWINGGVRVAPTVLSTQPAPE